MSQNYKEQNLGLLEQYFRDGCKLNCVQKLGVEIEHIIVRRDTRETVTYDGERGVAWILEQIRESYPQHFYEEDHLLGLYNLDYAISLEPAAQLEVSIVPKESIRVIRQIYESFLGVIRPVLEEQGYELMTVGYQPRSRVDELPLIPKRRYEYMDEYFKTSGTGGRNMMRGTAATQISIDYCCEQDFVRKYRAAYLLMPALKLLSDNTPVFEGQRWDGYLARTGIWDRVDPKRCGILPGLFDQDFCFRTYAEYLWDLPLIFLPAEGGPVYTKDRTVGELFSDRRMTEAEIEHVLSMTFLDVRVKHYVEIRGADSMPFPYVMAYLALVKGLFFEREALSRVLERCPADSGAIRAAEASLQREGFEGEIYGCPAVEFIGEILRIASEHLEEGERAFLTPFWKLLETRKTLAKEYYENDQR